MFKVYWAGDLFDHKHLTGNAILAQLIEQSSANKYTFILPQNWEGALASTIEMRNYDIFAIIRADLVLFNFDGPDLDSGTIVEFMIAKMLDIPVVLLRTDCRNGGYWGGEDWNLMASGFPRCITLKHNALQLYNDNGLPAMHQIIAQSIISAFEQVQTHSSLFTSVKEIEAAYEHVVAICGSNLNALANPAILKQIIAAKIEKKLYTTEKHMEAARIPPTIEI
jgi:nucleoside 2-deoxyribosyltransferase